MFLRSLSHLKTYQYHLMSQNQVEPFVKFWVFEGCRAQELASAPIDPAAPGSKLGTTYFSRDFVVSNILEWPC